MRRARFFLPPIQGATGETGSTGISDSVILFCFHSATPRGVKRPKAFAGRRGVASETDPVSGGVGAPPGLPAVRSVEAGQAVAGQHLQQMCLTPKIGAELDHQRGDDRLGFGRQFGRQSSSPGRHDMGDKGVAWARIEEVQTTYTIGSKGAKPAAELIIRGGAG